MPRIEMPDLEKVPAGPHRDLVAALQALYLQAGRPGTRLLSKAIMKADFPDVVSHETIAAILSGRSLPRWPKIHSLVLQLALWSVDRVDSDQLVKQIHLLWTAIQGGPAITINIRDIEPVTAIVAEALLVPEEETFSTKVDYSPGDWDPRPPRGMSMLYMIYGRQPGATFILQRSPWTIGRVSANDLVISESSVSRFHAQITGKGDEWVLKDLGSTNGTFVNTTRVQGECPLSDNDEIHIGNTRIKYKQR